MTQTENHKCSGGCLCGAITYSVDGAMRPVVACHCRMCQKSSGFHVAATSVLDADLTVVDPDGKLSWFASSDFAKRGFCSRCGGNLFYKRIDTDCTSIFAGTIDQPSGLTMAAQIFTEEAGDYYTPDPNVPSLSLEEFHEMRRTVWEK